MGTMKFTVSDLKGQVIAQGKVDSAVYPEWKKKNLATHAWGPDGSFVFQEADVTAADAAAAAQAKADLDAANLTISTLGAKTGLSSSELESLLKAVIKKGGM